MRMSDAQLRQYRKDGFFLIPEYFTRQEVETIRNEVPALLAKESEARVLERNGRAVRAVHGCHLENEIMRRLTVHPKLLEPAMQIVASGVYVYQFKINAKAGFDGEAWPWHQDFKHWYEEDGLSSPRTVSVALYLDDVTPFNGPLFVIPGSHTDGNWCGVKLKHSGWAAKYRADLKFTMDKQTVTELIARHGILSTEAPRGSALFFDVNVAHASASNISPFDRWIVIVTYNSIDNVPRAVREPRADFLVGQDCTPLCPVPWDSTR
jgi:L-proline 4-hydroxylase